MQLLKFKQILQEASKIIVTSNYVTGPGGTIYEVLNLNLLRRQISSLTAIPGLEYDVEIIKQSWVFRITGDALKVPSGDDSLLKEYIRALKNKISVLLDLIEKEESELGNPDVLLAVEIPQIDGFKNLEGYADDLEKAIGMPILNEQIGGHIKIVSGGKGSLILYITVGTLAAVRIIIKICWAAAVIKQKNIETKMMQAQVKTLDIKNEALEAIAEAIIIQQKKLLLQEAEAITTKCYSNTDPEQVERMKLSITSMALLLDKGVKILPVSNEPLPDNLGFPDYEQLNVASSLIKQISDSAEDAQK